MFDSNKLQKVMDFVEDKHRCQLDKSGRKYVGHLTNVANNCNLFIDIDTPQKECDFIYTVALLHDTLEDTETTYDELVVGFGKSIADHVNMLTRRNDMSYFDYIHALKHNEVCRKVKIADLLHNMDLTRLNKITQEDIQRNKKYLKALEVLVDMEG